MQTLYAHDFETMEEYEMYLQKLDSDNADKFDTERDSQNELND